VVGVSVRERIGNEDIRKNVEIKDKVLHYWNV
jgi:hypothetical protein